MQPHNKQVQELTWCALPEGLESLLVKDLPCTVKQAGVRRLTLASNHLQARLNDIGWSRQ